MVTDAEIEATLRQSKEIEAKLNELLKQAHDSSKNMAPLMATFDKERARIGEVMETENASAGTGQACVLAAVELLGDWADFEVAVTPEPADGAAGGRKPAAGGQRTAARRGMRI